MEIKGILVTLLAPMNDHIANGGEKILGNASSIKQRPDGRVYISGQKQRHALFSAMERLNFDDSERNGTYVSNGDGITTIIENDLRADLGGFLQTKKESYSGRRTAPLTATPAVALKPSEVGRDLLIQLKENPLPVIKKEVFNKLSPEEQKNFSTKDQALATREYSQTDVMLMNFFIDVSAVSIRKDFTYEGEMHLATRYVKHVSEDERKRRIRLALDATNSLTDYANNARNATTGEPQKVLIVFDTKLSRKAARFFNAEDTERRNILREIEKRGAVHFYGDDTADGDSVFDAYEKTLNFLNENTLFDPTNNAKPITTEQYEQRPTA